MYCITNKRGYILNNAVYQSSDTELSGIRLDLGALGSFPFFSFSVPGVSSNPKEFQWCYKAV